MFYAEFSLAKEQGLKKETQKAFWQRKEKKKDEQERIVKVVKVLKFSQKLFKKMFKKIS